MIVRTSLKAGEETGTVKWFSESKGYGIIAPDARGRDIFVHHNAIIGSGFRTLQEGARVSFDVVQGVKGLVADNVKVA